jgi:hypothetical protein
MDNLAFYNPKDLGYFDLGVTQVNKILRFKTTSGIFTPDAKIAIYNGISLYNGRNLVREYAFPTDLALTGQNIFGSEKILTLTLQGADYTQYRNATLSGECYSFFVEGDLEMIFTLQIK